MGRTSDAEFTQYVSAHGRSWERFAYLLTGDGARAQDIVQSVLLKAYRHWPRIARTEHPDAYVKRMITNSFLDWRRRRSSTEIPVGELPDGVDDPRPGPPDPATSVVERDELQRVLQLLSPHQRAVLMLRHIEGFDDETIAGMLGCSVGTVRTHASRGRERFRLGLHQERNEAR